MNQYSQADFRPPIPEAVQNANLQNYEQVYADSITHLEKFWDGEARKLKWFAPWTKVLDRSKAPFFSWFVDGKTNMILNCLDRHIDEGRGDKLALIYEGEPGDVRTFTFKQLALEVNKFANALKSLGIRKGDRVGVYMGRSPEQVIAMMACAKIGAVHNVVYGGLSVEALQSRLDDCGARLLIVADGGHLNGKIVKLLIFDKTLSSVPNYG